MFLPRRTVLLPALLIQLAACSALPSQGLSESDGGSLTDAGAQETSDAGRPADACASSFGDALTNAFGRLDGRVIAVVTPADTQCAMPNGDHVVVQVKMSGAVYRVVVNVRSDRGDPDVRLAELNRALPGEPWVEGWHPGVTLDYAQMLEAHSGVAPFTPYAIDALTRKLVELVPVGAEISAFATSSGGSYSHSAHKVHRNRPDQDGALVVNPRSANPLFLLFHFADQAF